jgi:glycosyltransferase involved in cell wall biosynthesis
VTTVYFCQRPLHRARQRETVQHCPATLGVLTPQGVAFTKDTRIREQYASRARKLTTLVRGAVPLNARWIRDDRIRDADFLYTWGLVPLNPRTPFVVELDNPYVLTFYNLRWFQLLRPALRRVLLSRRCRRIVCISEACKSTLRSELGPDVADKAAVVYPYVADRTDHRPAGGDTVHFLFVSTQYYLKGGRETLQAFERLVQGGANAHLFMVTNPPPEVVAEYRDRPWVTFVPADLDKGELHERYYRRADAFVVPTYLDSFGMVYLEALSFGLPIIATPTYAVPEMVVHDQSGLLVDPPFRPWDARGRGVAEYLSIPQAALGRRIESSRYDHVTGAVLAALRSMMDHERRHRMAAASRALFSARFADSVRQRAFLSAVSNLSAP